MTPRKPKAGALPLPPAHLLPETAAWWTSILRTFDLESGALRLLQLAAESWDRCQRARAVLDAEGTTYTDRFGAPRARPEVAVERDSRIAFARLLRELALDSVPMPDAPRPPMVAGGAPYGRDGAAGED